MLTVLLWERAASETGVLPGRLHSTGHPTAIQVLQVWQPRPSPKVIRVLPRQSKQDFVTSFKACIKSSVVDF